MQPTPRSFCQQRPDLLIRRNFFLSRTPLLDICKYVYPPVATLAGGGEGHGFDPGEQRAGGRKASDQTAAKDYTPHTVFKIFLVIKHFENLKNIIFSVPGGKLYTCNYNFCI